MFRRWHDPTSGLRSMLAPPRLSQSYAAQQNRPGLLVETHMMKPYSVRVDATYRLLLHTLRTLDDQHAELRRTVREADERTASAAFRAEPFALTFEATGDSVMVDFLGVDFEEVESDLTGGTWFRYGDQPTTYRVPYYNRHEPVTTVRLPAAYVIPVEWTGVIERLALHGVALQRLAEPTVLDVRGYRFADASWRERPYEGRHPVGFETIATPGKRLFPAGSAVVAMDQRTARVAAHILEPEAPDSYVYWGFFDAVFSRVEYIESYVIEDLAHAMIAADPALADSLAAAKAADPAFAADPRAIREWFYRRTPYYDPMHNVYPVGLIDDAALLESLPLEPWSGRMR
jgi:hypothetical protein